MFVAITILILLCIYIYNRLSCGYASGLLCLVGKTAIVTGGNKGIGYEICLNLASRGCKVIIADKDDSTDSRNKIIKSTKNPNILSKKIDLASFKSVRKFANEINQTEERLDILINNAGIGGSPNLLTEDGLNPVLQVNYFGPFLLTHLLTRKGLLKKSKPSRIIFTSSGLAFCTILRPKFLTSTEDCRTAWPALKFYMCSKLATIMASDTFAEKLKEFGVTSNSLHPGMIKTSIFLTVEKVPVWLSIFTNFLFLTCSKTVREGAQTAIHLATSEDFENVTRKHFWDCRKFIKPPQAKNVELCKKIWKISEECVKLAPEEKI